MTEIPSRIEMLLDKSAYSCVYFLVYGTILFMAFVLFCFFFFFRNLAKSQQRLVKLGNALDKVDREVAEMRKRYALTAVGATNKPSFQVMLAF